jgi:hypothetical protein
MKTSICAWMLCLGLRAILAAQSLTPVPSPAQPCADYDLRWDVKIPMRDKVELNATSYLPKTPDGSLPKTPVIFTLTPYIWDTYHACGTYFASHGYAFALVDVRGRGNSGGEFEPFANDPYYDAMVPTREQFKEITLPILTNMTATNWARLPTTGIILQTLHLKCAQNIFSSSARGITPARRGRHVHRRGSIYLRPSGYTRRRICGSTNPKEKTAAIDQTLALSIGADGLVYHTDPLPNETHETPVIGCTAVTLWLSVDTPDVDLECDLYEIQPDGPSILL